MKLKEKNGLSLNFEITYKEVIWFIFIAGIIIRLFYNIETDSFERQHDFFDPNGHMEYIKYLVNNLRLPDHNEWQFYHPPLHHIVMAVFYKLFSFFTTDDKIIAEFLQLITMTYSIILMGIFYKILKEIGLNGKYLCVAFAIFVFHPTNIIISGSLNNDMLMFLFYALGLLYTIKWYKSCSTKQIVIIALAIALSTLTKFSGITLSPIVAVVFLAAFITDKNKAKYIYQFALFAVICIPLALSHVIRNYIVLEQPLGYVVDLGKQNSQYISTDILKRMFIIPPEELGIVRMFCNLRGDWSLILMPLKSAVFGEYVFKNGLIFGLMLYYSNVLLAVSSVVGVIIYLIKNKSDRIIKFIILFNFALQSAFYVYFNYKYPYGCTTDFRYLLPLLISAPVMIVLAAKHFEESESDSKKRIGKCIIAVSAVFCVLSTVFYLINS